MNNPSLPTLKHVHVTSSIAGLRRLFKFGLQKINQQLGQKMIIWQNGKRISVLLWRVWYLKRLILFALCTAWHTCTVGGGGV